MWVAGSGAGAGCWPARGAQVMGVDLSPTMIAQARSRAVAEGVAERCRFQVQDLSNLAVGEKFDLVLGVTVLQHILDPGRLRSGARSDDCAPRAGRTDDPARGCADRGGRPLRHDGVHGAPSRRLFVDDARLRVSSCVRSPASTRRRFASSCCRTFASCPRPVSLSLLALATALSLPIDALFGRRAVNRSWHAVFVLEQEAVGRITMAIKVEPG